MVWEGGGREPTPLPDGTLAVTYSGMPARHTTIGAEHFHFRVRNGIGWFLLAIAARETGSRFVGPVLPPAPRASNSARFVFQRLSRSTINESLMSPLVAKLHYIILSRTDRLRLYGQASRAISTG